MTDLGGIRMDITTPDLLISPLLVTLARTSQQIALRAGEGKNPLLAPLYKPSYDVMRMQKLNMKLRRMRMPWVEDLVLSPCVAFS
ncbi:hypothetical protein BY996DRAFT_6595930 [Phakopsora pachyrhizi]|nr:hypothetical protein BY996DRAFT_6595930 [Phakopsora pachyrhizi]